MTTPLNHSLISGRIFASDKLNNGFATVVTMPSDDPFDKPQSARILSTKRLGAKGDDGQWLCKVMGYPRVSYGKKPDADGEFPKYNNCDGYFSLVE